MNQWIMISFREWEFINARGDVVGVVEETQPGWWEWSGLFTDDTGIESSRIIAMQKIEEKYNVSVH